MTRLMTYFTVRRSLYLVARNTTERRRTVEQGENRTISQPVTCIGKLAISRVLELAFAMTDTALQAGYRFMGENSYISITQVGSQDSLLGETLSEGQSRARTSA